MKRQVMISIDEEIHDRVKKLKMNVSEVCEEELKIRAGLSLGATDEEKVCFKCGKQGQMWLFPDEKWICKKCNKNETQKIIIGVVPQ